MFHELLTEQMDRAGVTPQALADCVGVNQATVYKWRTGAVMPRPWRVEIIAGCLGVAPTKLARAIYTDTSRRIGNGTKPPSISELLKRISVLEDQFSKLRPEDK